MLQCVIGRCRSQCDESQKKAKLQRGRQAEAYSPTLPLLLKNAPPFLLVPTPAQDYKPPTKDPNTHDTMKNHFLDSIRNMSGQKMYNLVNQQQLSRAMNYYQQGCINAFKWSSKDSYLSAYIQGQHEYQVTFNATSPTLAYSCDCPSFRVQSPACKHVVATLFTISNLLDESRFRPAPKIDNRAQLLQELLGENASDATYTDLQNPPVILTPCHYDGYELNRNDWGFSLLNTYITLSYSRGTTRDAKLIDLIAHNKPQILIHHQNETQQITQTNATPLKTNITANLQNQRLTLTLNLLENDTPLDQPYVFCSQTLIYLPQRKQLCPLKKSPLLAAYAEIRSFQTNDNTTFQNETPLAIPQRQIDKYLGELHTLFALPNITYAINGTKTKPLTGDYNISVELLPEPETDQHEIILHDTLQNQLMRSNNALEELEYEKFNDYSPNPLMQAKGRQKAIQQAEDAIYLAANKTAATDLIAQAIDLPLFQRSHFRQQAKRYLTHLNKEIHKKQKHIIPILNADTPAWFLHKNSLKEIATARALARQSFNIQPNGPYYRELYITPQQIQNGLPTFLSACTQKNIRVTYNHKEMRSLEPNVSLQIEKTDNIDWFELHPNVTAKGLNLKQKQWEQLIRGELIKGENDTYWVLGGDSAALLQRLQEIMTRASAYGKKQGGKTAIYPRLHIFDWLSLQQAGIKLQLPQDAQDILDSLRSFSKIPPIKTPSQFKGTLRSYQKEGLSWLTFLYKHQFGACLADDMGLGKTIQTIAFLAAISKQKTTPANQHPHLLVVPPSLLYNWQHEIHTFCPHLKTREYAGPQRNLKNLQPNEILLTTYELIRRDIDTLQKQPFNIAILDETQQIKNTLSRRSQAIQKINAHFRLCLTGTPLENHLGEYFNIMDAAVPGLLEDARPFTKTKDSTQQEKYIHRTRPFLLRRIKSDVLKELPDKQEADTYLDMTPLQKELYTRTVGEVREQVLQLYKNKSIGQAGIVALSALTRLRQICVTPALLDPKHKEPSPKLTFLTDKLTELTSENHAALVFSQFTRALDQTEPLLTAADLPYVRLDGSMSVAKRKKAIAAFQDQQTHPIFLISLKAGGVGLNLTRASYVFHIDPWWNPAVETQATDRAHRIGQKNKVMVNRLLMHHSIEEKLMALKQQKQALFQKVIEQASTGKTTTGLSRKDFEFLLS